MSSVNKSLALLFVFLVLQSLFVLTITPVNVFGQEISKPSMPQFSVRVVGDYCYVPPSTTNAVDPYTGKEKTITQQEYYKDERKIEVSIKNQPFTPYTDTYGRKYSIYYNVQFKGHFDDEYKKFCTTTFQTDSDYTTPNSIYTIHYFEVGSQIDFRVEALIGREFSNDESMLGPLSNVYYSWDEIGVPHTLRVVVSSGWSEAVTFIVPEPGEATTLSPSNTSPANSPTLASDVTPFEPSNTATSPPQQPPYVTYLLIITVTVCIIIVPFVIVLYHNKHQQHKRKTTTNLCYKIYVQTRP